MEKSDLILGLARCSFLSCAEKAFLAKKLDNLESLTVLSIEDICLILGRVIRTRCWEPEKLDSLVERDLSLIQRFGIGFVSVMSAAYPPLLREIHDPPFAVFWRGTLPDPEHTVAAIVGTRAPSGNGALAAARLGTEFAEYGIPVVSGLARGIDAFAHRGNIEGGGKSIAVLACGVDQIYPRSNARLASRLIESGGCILSEYQPGELPLQYRFPQRNRIISGLARAVIVVEAPEKSGALITADFALEQGRDLFVFADTLDSARGKGTRLLFEQGAPAIRSAFSILDTWGYDCRKSVKKCEPDSALRFGEVSRNHLHPETTGRQLALEFRKELDLL